MTKKEGKVLKGFLTAAMAYSLVTTCPILLPVVALSAVWCDKRKRRRQVSVTQAVAGSGHDATNEKTIVNDFITLLVSPCKRRQGGQLIIWS